MYSYSFDQSFNWWLVYRGKEVYFKASFNNTQFTKISAAWPYMLSVSLIRCKNEALKNLYFKSIIKCFKRVKIDKWLDSPCSYFPIDYCVRIKYWQTIYSMVIFSHRFLDSDCINFKTFAHLAVYWPFWTSLYNIDIKVQQYFKSILHDVKQCL